MKPKFQFLIVLFVITSLCFSIDSLAEEVRWLQAGKLHNWFSAAGCEVEVGRRHEVRDQQDGFRYPADRSTQDMQAAKGLWIGARNFNDLIAGQTYSYKVVHAGPRILDLENEFMPVLMKLIRKQSASRVYVDGKNSTSLYDKADEIDASISSDEMIQNVVNTSIGITITRTIYAYGHPNHDNYFIYDFEFKNTGIYDRDGNVSTQILEDVIFFFQYRWAVSKYMGAYGLYYAPQDATWGVNTVNEVLHPEYGDAVRASYAWHGLHSGFEGDNIGAPYIGTEGTGFLGAAQFPGIVTLHADKSTTDKTDDPQQPRHQIPINSDENVTQTSFNDQFIESNMTTEYVEYMASGLPDQTHADMVGDDNANELPLAGGGGVSQGIGYGPYTLEPGQNIHIVMAEAAGSINWKKRVTIGSKWYNEIPPYNLPDGSTTDDKDEYKNSWVFTGVDSLMQVFASAKTTWQNNFTIDPIPPAPGVFEVTSMSDRVRLQWDNQAENYPHFAGYRIYRADGSLDAIFQLIYECGQGSVNPLTNQYDDLSVNQGMDYYYYIATYDDGTVNTIDPGKSLESSRFWTLTSHPAYLREVDAILADVFVSPDGDDANDGLTTTTPFRTIGHALSRIVGSILEDRTIHLAEGIYSPSTTGDVFPLPGKNSVKIEGIGSNTSIIDAESSGTIFDIKDIQNFHIVNLTLCNGYADHGGGIHMSGNATVKISGVKITDNTANLGGGIYIEDDAVLKLDSLNRCDIYHNVANEGRGADIYSLSMVPRSICVDSFTVKNPCDYLAYPVESFQFDINAGYIPQIAGNAYVSPDGNDFNDGSSVTSPLKTFRQAIIKMDATEENSGTIHLVEGIYSPSTTGEQFPVYGRSHVKIMGSGASNCILDAEQTNRGIITSYDQNFSIENLSVQNGNSTFGGGIYISPYAKVDLKNLIIKSNKASEGGGIMITGGSSVNLSNVKIVGNQASIRGGGLYFDNYCNVQFDSLNRCDIYSNTATGEGYDIFTTSFNRLFSVYLDTFTVYYPIERYAAPIEAFQFSINAGLIPQAEADLYVSPNGSNNNDGLSPETPMQTLGAALEYIFADQHCPHTIYLGEGVYSSSTNAEEFPIKLRDYITLQGMGDSLTIIDGEHAGRIFECSEVNSVNIKGLSIINGYDDYGAGIYCDQSGLTLEDVWIKECKGSYGAGIYAENNSIVQMKFVSITDDSARYGGAIGCRGSKVEILNSTIANNDGRFGGVFIQSDYEYERISNIFIVNTIIWKNGDYEIVAYKTNPIFAIVHSDIYEIVSQKYGDNTLNWMEGNIDSDPLFIGGDPFDYRLSTGSPCRETGTNLVVLEGDTLFYLPDSCYSGSTPNIGRWGVDPALGIESQDLFPDKFVLYPNYPNPFNPSTTIAYEIPKPSQVEILIFDITGRQVCHLVHSKQQAGYYQVIWDGKNNNGLEVPSGQYFLLMKTEHCRKTQKMVFLK
ncbi:MAG: T9SS type A sorting domain-containing protein [Candidatus Marinimicrobia bacterium]|nr:T9SS type A sorting domain-containing protein [Candidatus Neomarinimicrobiota bacterium]